MEEKTATPTVASPSDTVEGAAADATLTDTAASADAATTSGPKAIIASGSEEQISGATIADSTGVFIEGNALVSLDSTNLTIAEVAASEVETTGNITIYQLASKKEEDVIGTISINNSSITVAKGDTFYATNTFATINLIGSKIVNQDQTSVLLRAKDCQVSLFLTQQVVEGDIILDAGSTLVLSFYQSYYMGAVNTDNLSKEVTFSLDKDSNFVLTGDTYISTLMNEDETNQNIYSNGYKLYVEDKEIAINGSTVPEAPEVALEESAASTTTEVMEEIITTTGQSCQETFFTDCNGAIKTPILIAGAALVIILIAVLAFIIHSHKKKSVGGGVVLPSDLPPEVPAEPAAPATPATPVEPAAPEAPVVPATPETPAEPAAPAAPTTPEPTSEPSEPASPQNVL